MNTLLKKNLSKRVAFMAVTLALTFVTSLLPGVFLLPLITAAILTGAFGGFAASLFFAGVSLMYAFVMPVSPAALSFIMHPWVAIVPRLPLGIICFLCYKGVSALTRKAKSRFVRETLPVSAGAVAASLLNTALVVGSLAIFYANDAVLDTTVLLSVPYMLIMGVIEAVAVAVLSPLIIWALRKTPAFRSGGGFYTASAYSTAEKNRGGNKTRRGADSEKETRTGGAKTNHTAAKVNHSNIND